MSIIYRDLRVIMVDVKKKEEATGALSELNFHWRLAKIFNAGVVVPGPPIL